MAEIDFYQLSRSALEDVLPRLLQKTLDGGQRAVVLLSTPERVEAVNARLWSFDAAGEADSFIPHGSSRDGMAERQPIWLTHVDENPNGAGFLFVADGARSARHDGYARCFEIFDGRNDDTLADARERWRAFREAGHTLRYWAQTDGGGWERKA